MPLTMPFRKQPLPMKLRRVQYIYKSMCNQPTAPSSRYYSPHDDESKRTKGKCESKNGRRQRSEKNP
ncbi:hypothetical protein VTJ04DRAFT_3342 [Mycothermus thermophilus]|uniref:uncharacterized protein n=1 Tax=Humicola insolens TaxID=85995 RepID=UPI003743A5A0